MPPLVLVSTQPSDQNRKEMIHHLFHPFSSIWSQIVVVVAEYDLTLLLLAEGLAVDIYSIDGERYVGNERILPMLMPVSSLWN
jgi:hypothetical protein